MSAGGAVLTGNPNFQVVPVQHHQMQYHKSYTQSHACPTDVFRPPNFQFHPFRFFAILKFRKKIFFKFCKLNQPHFNIFVFGFWNNLRVSLRLSQGRFLRLFIWITLHLWYLHRIGNIWKEFWLFYQANLPGITLEVRTICVEFCLWRHSRRGEPYLGAST